MGPTLGSVAAAALAAAATLLFDLACRRRGLDPPGFAEPARRAAGLAAIGLVLWIGVFAPLTQLGSGVEVDFSQVPTWQLFLVHGLLVAGLLGWYAAGFGLSADRLQRAGEQLGFRARSVPVELGLGAVLGVAAWVVVLLAVFAVALLVIAFGGGDLLPRQPPAAIPWLAAQSVALRLSLAASAGLVEETFFRGLLQPRIGILASTALFAFAHLAYDQPFMLVGVTLLSLLYGLLVKWRQSVWAAVVAHFVFDAVQLLIVIPYVLERTAAGGP